MPPFRLAPTLTALLLLAACARAPDPAERVTHEERALAKANAAWAGLYSQRADDTFSPPHIRRFAPYTAVLENGVWIVRGTAPAEFHGSMPGARVRESDGVTTIQVDER